MSFYPWNISCHHVSIDGMFMIYGMPTTFIDTSYSYIMSSCLHSHHILKYVILSCLVSHHTLWNCVMLSCLISHHICEIMSCYSVCLDNINVNYFMPCCRCQNRRISGRGSQAVRLRINGNRRQGTRCFYPGSGPLGGGKTLLLLD